MSEKNYVFIQWVGETGKMGKTGYTVVVNNKKWGWGMGGGRNDLMGSNFTRVLTRASEDDKIAFGSYYQKAFETIAPAEIMKLINNTQEAGALLVEHLTKGNRIELHHFKQAVFFTLMRNHALISQCLKPKRDIVKGVGLFNQDKVVWSIEDSALKAVLNYGSKTRKVHAEHKPTATLNRLYKLLEAKYQRDAIFRNNVDQRWEPVSANEQANRPLT